MCFEVGIGDVLGGDDDFDVFRLFVLECSVIKAVRVFYMSRGCVVKCNLQEKKR